MKVLLLRDSRIMHKAGEIVEVTQDAAAHLISVQSAVVVTEPEKPAKTTKKTTKRAE